VFGGAASSFFPKITVDICVTLLRFPFVFRLPPTPSSPPCGFDFFACGPLLVFWGFPDDLWEKSRPLWDLNLPTPAPFFPFPHRRVSSRPAHPIFTLGPPIPPHKPFYPPSRATQDGA